MEPIETRIGVLANWGILDALSPFPRSDSMSMLEVFYPSGARFELVFGNTERFCDFKGSRTNEGIANGGVVVDAFLQPSAHNLFQLRELGRSDV